MPGRERLIQGGKPRGPGFRKGHEIEIRHLPVAVEPRFLEARIGKVIVPEPVTRMRLERTYRGLGYVESTGGIEPKVKAHQRSLSDGAGGEFERRGLKPGSHPGV